MGQSIRGFEQWYFQNKDKFDRLKERICEIVTRGLQEQGIEIVGVQARIKSLQSCKDKISSKKYTHPEQLEDLVGIRIICYFLSDYEVQYEFVKQNFWIIRHEPVCKPTGYKADHFVVTLNEERIMLVEYNRFKHIKFEIQVCTVLEHAWNEIEHNRGYKGELPSKLQSRFQLLARGLHRLDERFQKIAIESVNYESALSRKTLEDIPISPPH